MFLVCFNQELYLLIKLFLHLFLGVLLFLFDIFQGDSLLVHELHVVVDWVRMHRHTHVYVGEVSD